MYYDAKTVVVLSSMLHSMSLYIWCRVTIYSLSDILQIFAALTLTFPLYLCHRYASWHHTTPSRACHLMRIVTVRRRRTVTTAAVMARRRCPVTLVISMCGAVTAVTSWQRETRRRYCSQNRQQSLTQCNR